MQLISFMNVMIQQLVWTIKPTAFVNNYDLKSFLIFLKTYYVFLNLYKEKKSFKMPAVIFSLLYNLIIYHKTTFSVELSALRFYG